jgi:hypothetical protein
MSVPDPTAHALDPGNLPATVKPEAADVLILVGGVAGAVLLFSLAAKFISPVSIWENKEGMLYQMVKPFLKGKYVLMGKPE